jgi:N utilization substance protein B
MQILYSMSQDNSLEFKDVLNRYQAQVNKSFQLYLFNLLYFLRIAEYARQDAKRRNSKHLPSEEDKQFTAKLCENELIQSLRKNEGLHNLFKHYKLQEKVDKDKLRLLYTEFAKTKEYKAYVLKKDTGPKDHTNIFLSLYKHCVQSETFEDVIEDHFPQWVDDKSLIIGAMKKTIKALPASNNFFEEYRPTKETTKDFGEELLKKVNEMDEELLQIIEPTLNNWDADRVAVIDMILLKMALCELMTFPTIPSKVTLNEFVEISKLYSTEKSKDFINGILDRLMKKLNKEGKIKKKGRGLLE